MFYRIMFLFFVLIVSSHAHAATWYVKATAHHDGNGSKSRPFQTLEAAEAASGAGDTIYIIHTKASRVLDGRIVLKPNQRLIGLGPDVTRVPDHAAAARVTYSGVSSPADGSIVQLASGNEISNIHFIDLSVSAIVGTGADYSGANVHGNLFTGSGVDNGWLRYSVYLESYSGDRDARVTNNVVRDGSFLSGFVVNQYGTSSAACHFQNNHFDNIGSRAYVLQTSDSASIQADILDSSANDIGAMGEYSGIANSDSILMLLNNSSTQDVLIDGYTYDNTSQVGGVSNTGLELFFAGPGWPEQIWADNAHASLKIRNSSFSNAVTEAIQLLNLGSNSVMDVEITNTTVVNANPRQLGPLFGLVGGAVSVLPSAFGASGNQAFINIEGSDIIDSSGYAVGVYDSGATGFETTLDLGGGVLGSSGQNRILGNAVGEIELFLTNGIGRLNWWGGDTPRIDIAGGGSFDTLPELPVDPRP